MRATETAVRKRNEQVAWVRRPICFEKVPALKALAPTQKEPPFVVAQRAALLFFAALTVLANVRFHPETVRTV